MPQGPVAIRGLRELQGAFAKADKDERRYVRAELRDVARPIAEQATQNAVSRISRMARSPRWSRMRIGVSRSLVYVAPRERGVKRKGYLRRARGHQFADLLMDRAMEPALAAHEHEVVNRIDHALDRMADHFNRGGIV